MRGVDEVTNGSEVAKVVSKNLEAVWGVVEAPTTAAHLFWVVHKSHGGKLLIA